MDATSPMASLNWLAILVAAIVPFAIGFLWYGPLFAKAWMRLTGISEEKARQANMAKIYGTTFVLNLVIAFSLAMFIGANDWKFGLFAGFMSGFTFVAMAFGVTYLFEQRPFRLWAINAGYQTVTFTVMGAILGAWH
jgi:hypothetical protein